MEKIKKAVEDSRKGNLSNKKKSAYRSKITRTNNPSKEINYVSTRIVDLNPLHLLKNRIVSFNKSNHLSLSFDILRTQVIKKMQENNWRTIGITSPIAGCGKTVVSINLGMSIAQHTNRTALLVDFDLRRPTVAKYLGITSGNSLNEVLSGESEISDALVCPGVDRFVVLPTARPVANSSELLSSDSTAYMIEELAERYDERIVIFDMPPILGTDDAMIMVSRVDCVLVVVGNGMVSKSELNESLRYIDSEKIIGTVLNKVERPEIQSTYYT